MARQAFLPVLTVGLVAAHCMLPVRCYNVI
nr:MAG TPA: hypothetical protein [Caudoviricetes sp.]